jgi:hypothetical protein
MVTRSPAIEDATVAALGRIAGNRAALEGQGALVGDAGSIPCAAYPFYPIIERVPSQNY